MDLPVDPEKLRQEFPELSAGDLDAYVTVTRLILAAGKDRSMVTKKIMEGARAAREKIGQDLTLSADETIWLRYLSSVEKMQRSTTKGKKKK